MFQLGEVPFFSDYICIAGVDFVQPTPGGSWAFNTAPSKANTLFASWTSNQDVIPPYDPSTGLVDWSLYRLNSVVNAGDSKFSPGEAVRSAMPSSREAETRTSTAP
jgi:hypothetical protein